jgi:nucleoid DNA-binding protein/cell division protein FtsN
LIIPTVGAFIVKETEDTQTRVIFSSFLKYDDGLLTKLLCKQKNISEEQAQQMVENFAHEILNSVDNGNNFYIPDFGYFKKNNQGVIDFVVEIITDNIPESKIKEEKPEEPIFPPYVPPVMETPVFDNAGQNTPNNFDFSNIYVPPVSTTDTTPKTKEKTSNVGYWILAIVLIIIAVALLLYLFSKDFKQTVNSLFKGESKVEIVQPPTNSGVVADTAKVQQEDTVVTKQDETTQQTNSTSTSTPNGKYQVIAGCYLERTIAEDFADKLRSKGHTVRIPDRLAGEWSLVIVYESNDLDDATRVKDSFVAEGYSDAWVRTKAGYAETTNRQTSSYSNTTNRVRGRYQAIAGCFLERENAETFANKLRDKGFNVIMPDNLMGEWTILILSESDDWDEVNKVKEQCIAAGYDAWIRTR